MSRWGRLFRAACAGMPGDTLDIVDTVEGIAATPFLTVKTVNSVTGGSVEPERVAADSPETADGATYPPSDPITALIVRALTAGVLLRAGPAGRLLASGPGKLPPELHRDLISHQAAVWDLVRAGERVCQQELTP